MTPFGNEVFAAPRKGTAAVLLAGDAAVAWFPLNELFSLRTGADYAALVCLREGDQSTPQLVSAPVHFRAPEPEVAGVNRPFYGSSALWEKLVAAGSHRDSRVDIRCEVDQQFAAPRHYLRVTLGKRSGQPFGKELATADITILVRDRRGATILPFWEADVLERFGGRGEAPLRDAGACGQGRFGTLFQAACAGDPNAHGFCEPSGGGPAVANVPIRYLYAIFPCQQYTFLAAVATKGDSPSFAVAKPVTYVPEFAMPAAAKAALACAEAATEPAPAPRAAECRELSRFAGEHFGGLVLKAAERSGALSCRARQQRQ